MKAPMLDPFNEVAGLRSATLYFKKTLAQVFSCEFYEIFKKTFFVQHLWATASGIIKENIQIHLAMIIDQRQN